MPLEWGAQWETKNTGNKKKLEEILKRYKVNNGNRCKTEVYVNVRCGAGGGEGDKVIRLSDKIGLYGDLSTATSTYSV